MSPGDSLTFNVSAAIPVDMSEGLAIACLTIFDDTVSNNCKTLTVTRPAALSSATFAQDCGSVGGDQIWLAIRQVLRDQGLNLDDYNFTGMEGNLTCAELSALLDQLRQGQARASLSGPPLTAPLPPPSSAPIAKVELDKGARPPTDLQNSEEQPKTVVKEQTWSGVMRPLSKTALAVTIKSEADWKRFWPKLSDEPVPLIDFTAHSVIAVMAGKEDGADRIEIDNMQSLADKLTVKYRLVSYVQPFAAVAAKTSPAGKPVPYLLIAIPRTSLKINFERIKESSDGND
jgi:hypothetical protein